MVPGIHPPPQTLLSLLTRAEEGPDAMASGAFQWEKNEGDSSGDHEWECTGGKAVSQMED